jgi:hypothetical protein
MGLLTQRGPPSWHPAPPEVHEDCAKASQYAASQGADISKLALQFSVRCGCCRLLVGGGWRVEGGWLLAVGGLQAAGCWPGLEGGQGGGWGGVEGGAGQQLPAGMGPCQLAGWTAADRQVQHTAHAASLYTHGRPHTSPTPPALCAPRSNPGIATTLVGMAKVSEVHANVSTVLQVGGRAVQLARRRRRPAGRPAGGPGARLG